MEWNSFISPVYTRRCLFYPTRNELCWPTSLASLLVNQSPEGNFPNLRETGDGREIGDGRMNHIEPRQNLTRVCCKSWSRS
ncbi:hypothetical protein RRG08_039246 [Elysia crispata]|uniref:Uncharacterized protein n=1 Tax=Elysia crispata TaxID=231223 RepID=A0AAE1BEE6_9GAST|nr:hypothetical protein RRG08_039246 [Elysia crispata]